MSHTHPHTHPHTHRVSRRDFLRLSALGVGSLFLSSCQNGAQPSSATSAATPRTESVTPQPANILNTIFDSFSDQVKTRRDERYLYVESDGMPTHPMMIGIRSWQQQVPLPQPYSGNNAWSIPLKPVLADKPISAKTALYRGAIALAANGVPIFNALNNRGDDALLAGELDSWGGHSGRADDYHYHIAPLHLQKVLGENNPIAYALDGFPIYGTTEADGSTVSKLDEFNGHFDKTGNYHYHATQTYPYINGGLRGIVQVRDDQIEPQPRLIPVRQFLQPLRGATVTGFTVTSTNAYSLEYDLNGGKCFVNYSVQGSKYIFEFVDAAGKKKTETFSRDGRPN